MTPVPTSEIMRHLGAPGQRAERLEQFLRVTRLAAQSNRAAITFPSADDIHAMAQLSLVATDMLADIRDHCRAAMTQGQCLNPAALVDYITGNLPHIEEIIHGQSQS